MHDDPRPTSRDSGGQPPVSPYRDASGDRPPAGDPGQRAGGRRQQLGQASRTIGRGSTRVAGASGRLAKGTVKRMRQVTHSGGAGESGLARLLELHAFNTAADSALAVSLAGTLFFQVPSGEARGQIALFLGLTMLPFAIVAPLIGPMLDRFGRGRRWAIGATMAVRAFACWAMAGAVTSDSVWLFPAALTCLVASKAYGVTRASVVPRLLPPDMELVKTNSRISLVGTAAAAISGPFAALTSLIGPQWSLRYAFLLFIVATVLAVLLPARVDSAEGEEQIGYRQMGTGATTSRLTLPGVVIAAFRCNAGLRALSGFMIMFMAFLLRSEPIPGWEDRTPLLLGIVLGAAGAGSTLGNILGSVLKGRQPESIVVAVLVLDAGMVVVAAFFYGLVAALALGATVGLCQSLGKLSLDALIQREVPERVRTSVFARAETLLQLSWVIGGFIGIFMPLIPRLGLGVAAALLLAWVVVVLRGFRAQAHRPAHEAAWPSA